MGVHGWNRLLTEEGWLPYGGKKSQRDGSSFWMNKEVLEQSHSSFEDRLVDIPKGSTLHIDGFALCFQVHRVAHARHCQQILKKNPSKTNKKGKPWRVRQMIPCFLPSSLLTETLEEFIEALRGQCKLVLIVYWDGKKRYAPPTGSFAAIFDKEKSDVPSKTSTGLDAGSDVEGDDNSDSDVTSSEERTPAAFKNETEQVRLSQRADEWSVLQDYCIHGRIPTDDWEREFPKNRMFVGQIMQHLYLMNVAMEFCEEEADSIMARTISGKSSSYILGFDSDFCFFPTALYIPSNTLLLDQETGTLRAIVLCRDILAESLEIPETSMVELAILMGNDYVSDIARFDLPEIDTKKGKDESPCPTKKQLLSKSPTTKVKAFIKLLRYHGEGFQVQSHDPDISECLLFIRILYNLGDMSKYEMEETTLGQEPSLLPAAIGMTVELSLALQTASMDQGKGDTSLRDAVVRYLEMIIEHQEKSDTKLLIEDAPALKVLTQSHIEAFKLLSLQRPPYPQIDKQIKDSHWRPLWSDVPAVYWIERLINVIVRNAIEELYVREKQILDKIQSPGDVFDSYGYHAYLKVAREASLLCVEATVDAGDVEMEVPILAEEWAEETETKKLKLPVDEHHREILDSVKKNRVTIIQGDTGCGKSSRIPVMLLNAPPPNPNQAKTKLFISQPRRIAAKALVERLRSVEPDLKDEIALRMGHGVREYETAKTRAWFVTTGYLVRLLANHPERFEDVSVLIVDEVHERSVDTDILCLLCRRLLDRNKYIRLVLMSATLAADMYQQYFGVPEPPIRVGARRFPVKEVFLDDLKKAVRLSNKDAKKTNELLNESLKLKCQIPPPMQYMEKLFQVVANLATAVGKPGTSVLIFVPGMNEKLVESVTMPGTRFTCIPIHSDIPFEDQMLVFSASKADEAKIVIATNAAESSLTLPEVDNVICLGLCKQIVYNEASHRQMLTPTWISRASATQRAGRTGRVRPGTVYRMYARDCYESCMDPFEPGEMLRIPLDSVILMLKEMLPEDRVGEVLCTCLEPPDLSTIDRSFQSLHKSHFITSPDDSCDVTNLGSFVSSLGIDLALGSLIGLGVQMGVGAEAVQMAAILSFPKSPWVMSNPLIHPTSSFNENTSKSFVSRCHFDANLFSEPLAIMNLVFEYERLKPKEVQKWKTLHNIFLPRIRRLASTTVNLRKRVADFLGLRESLLEVKIPPLQMSNGMITLLRIIQVWVFHESVIQLDFNSLSRIQKKFGESEVVIDLLPQSDTIDQGHLDLILSKERHQFSLKGSCELRQKGNFEYIPPPLSSSSDFKTRLETHVISYATENKFSLVCLSFQDSCMVYTVHESATEKSVMECIYRRRKEDTKSKLHATANEGTSHRGIKGRACGLWKVESPSNKPNSDDSSVTWSRLNFDLVFQKEATTSEKEKEESSKKELRSIVNALENIGRVGDFKSLFLSFPWDPEVLEPETRFKFSLSCFGTTRNLSSVDMRDLLGPRFESTTRQIAGKQKIQFPLCENKPLVNQNRNDEENISDVSSWNRPLVNCIPEGARVVSALIGSRRRENIIRLVPLEDNTTGVNDDGDDDDGDICLYFDKTINPSCRWKRFNTNLQVYIDPSTVPATAVPVDNSSNLYCVCANTLEVRGGGFRAEGLTLLPQGKAFLLLARLCFGLFQDENVEDDTLIDKALRWIGDQTGNIKVEVLAERLEQSIEFHESAIDLGETLVCFPDKVAELLEIFDGIDGYEAQPWETLSSNPFIRGNLFQHQKRLREENELRFYRRESSGRDGDRNGRLSPTIDERDDDGNDRKENSGQIVIKHKDNNPHKNNDQENVSRVPDFFSAVSISQLERKELRLLFEGTSGTNNFGSCSKLVEILEHYRLAEGGKKSTCLLQSPDWEFYTINLEGVPWFKAVFKPDDIEYTEPRKGTGAWQNKKDHWKARPRTVADAIRCAPGKYLKKERVRIVYSSKHLAFRDLQLAIQMEAAFWLERQFGSKKRRWYEQPEISQMLSQLKKTPSDGQKKKKKKQKKKPSKQYKKKAQVKADNQKTSI